MQNLLQGVGLQARHCCNRSLAKCLRGTFGWLHMKLWMCSFIALADSLDSCFCRNISSNSRYIDGNIYCIQSFTFIEYIDKYNSLKLYIYLFVFFFLKFIVYE